MWYICFFISIAVLIAASFAAFALANKKKATLVSPANTMIVGAFIASTLLFVPIYAEMVSPDFALWGWAKTILVSMHHAIRLFVVDSDFELVRNASFYGNEAMTTAFSCYASILFVLCPLLTFGVVLSFFKNAAAYRKYIKSFNRKMYVFSSLNEKSIALAESVLEKDAEAKIVFTGVSEEESEKEVNVSKIKSLNAICFRNDLLRTNFNVHSKAKEIYFFLIDEDEAENVKQALDVIGKYKNREKTWLYVFSNEFEGEVLLSTVEKCALKIRRVSDVRTLVYSVLETFGERIFKEAVTSPENPDEKLISAVVVGMGKYGTEMTKSLAWFGQMGGYRIEITSFDKDEQAKERLAAICPELMDDKFNGQFTDDGEAQYRIDVRGGFDVETGSFLKEISTLSDITYVFVDLGTDEDNIKTAIKLRTLLLKDGRSPRIQAIVEHSEKKRSLIGIKNHSGQNYDIDFVGDVESFYVMGSIIDSDLENEALARHLKWGDEDAFWKYEYNYRSSIASALHRRMKILCKVPGVDKKPAERSEEDGLNLRKMEHRRWNAYMRSEGFTYAEKRNNLAKTHNCLVTYENLTPEEKAKDDD